MDYYLASYCTPASVIVDLLYLFFANIFRIWFNHKDPCILPCFLLIHPCQWIACNCIKTYQFCLDTQFYYYFHQITQDLLLKYVIDSSVIDCLFRNLFSNKINSLLGF